MTDPDFASLNPGYGHNYWTRTRLLMTPIHMEAGMARARSSPQHKALRAFLAKQRQDAGLRQEDLAKKLKRRQDYVSDIETGQKVVTVVELMEWAGAVGFDPAAAIRMLKQLE